MADRFVYGLGDSVSRIFIGITHCVFYKLCKKDKNDMLTLRTLRDSVYSYVVKIKMRH